MTTQSVSTAPVPSIATLAKTTAIALFVAGVILITLVLPAEYGIDPLGTGARLGLTALANPPIAVVEMPKTEGAALVPTMKGPIGEYPSGFKFDVFEIELAPYEYVEYKYSMEQGASMLFAWTATGGLRHDMHAERAKGAGEGPAEESFDKQDRRQGTGSYAAPFTGIHGWYWENPGGEAIKVRLTTAGFYSGAIEIRSDRSRHPHKLQVSESLPATALGTP
jgi:hypothetical protein